MQPTSPPLISVITPSLNQAHYLQQAIQSVQQQTYPHIEHIVIDGGSSDGTLQLLRQQPASLRWVTQPDTGQAQAINRGMRLARGSILAWLNADDIYLPHTAAQVARHFQAHPQHEVIFGHAHLMTASGCVIGRRNNVRPVTPEVLRQEDCAIVQPATFWRARVMEQYGLLDENLHYALDYEYWLRLSAHIPLVHVPYVLAAERSHTEAKTVTGGVARLLEIHRVITRYGEAHLPQKFLAEARARHCVHRLRPQHADPVPPRLRAGHLQIRYWFRMLMYLLALASNGLLTPVTLRQIAARLTGTQQPESRLP
jgi:glycosyltransferase involved in cell wall biosynthesis